MSIARKCDRCRKLYEDYDGCEVEVQEGGHRYNKLELLRGWNDACRIYDLCPECMKSLIKWIKEAEK